MEALFEIIQHQKPPRWSSQRSLLNGFYSSFIQRMPEKEPEKPPGAAAKDLQRCLINVCWLGEELAEALPGPHPGGWPTSVMTGTMTGT